MFKLQALLLSAFFLLLSGFLSPALALENGALATIMELLKNRDVISEQEYKELLTQLDDHEKKQQKKVDWTSRFKFSGDIRLRYQGDFMSSSNPLIADPSDPGELLNTFVDRNRFRLRLRLNIAAQINPDADVKLRLATGNLSDPVSTNSTLGGYFDSENFSLDRAYLEWRLPLPSETHKVKLLGGRMPNPWLSSDLLWDGDLNFEGAALQYVGKMYPVGFFTTLGAFPLSEFEFSKKDKWLYAAQAGIQYRPSSNVSAKLALAYYHFSNVTGKTNASYLTDENDYTMPAFQQKGNTLMDISPAGGDDALDLALASEFKELNLIGIVDLAFWNPVHVSMLFDVVQNLGFDRNEVSGRAGGEVPDADFGYQVGIEVGYQKINQFGDWSTSLFYKYLEADAVLDAFTDSDFHLGGTNAQGWILAGSFGLAKNIWLSGKWITTDEIKATPFATDTVQVDLNGRF